MVLHVLKHWQSYVGGLVSILAMWLLQQYPTMLGALLISVIWFLILVALYIFMYRDNTERVTYGIGGVMLFLGSLGLYFLVEQRELQYLLVPLHAAVLGFYLYIPKRLGAKLAHEFKPWRRMLSMILTYSVFASMSTLFGVMIFFQARSVVGYVLCMSIISSLVAYVSLRLYHRNQLSTLRRWSIVIGLLSFELLIALSFTSFGYLVQGAMFTWFWYVLLLFVRFHISSRGIDWEKQKLFVIGNVIAFGVLLQLVQWF